MCIFTINFFAAFLQTNLFAAVFLSVFLFLILFLLRRIQGDEVSCVKKECVQQLIAILT